MEPVVYILLFITSVVGLTFIVGGRPQEIRIGPDAGRMSLYGVPLKSLIDSVRAANVAFPAGDPNVFSICAWFWKYTSAIR